MGSALSAQRGSAQSSRWRLCGGKGNQLPPWKRPQSCVLEVVQAGGGGQLRGREGLEGENHVYIDMQIRDRRKMQWESGARGSSLQGKPEPVLSLPRAKGLGQIRNTTEIPKDTLYSSELLGNILILQAHNFHLHYCNLGQCPTSFHK